LGIEEMEAKKNPLHVALARTTTARQLHHDAKGKHSQLTTKGGRSTAIPPKVHLLEGF
jgi:hypothetical protein